MKYCPECGTKLTEDATSLTCDSCGYTSKKDKKQDSVSRQDVRDISWESHTAPMTMTEDGYLAGRAAVTNIGVFPYRLPSGKIRHELRLPQEVFKADSLSSMNNLPITDNHQGRIDASNISKFSIGAVGSDIGHDEYRVYAPVTFTKQDAISSIQNGKRALSCGYVCDLDFTPGVWMGIHYDAIQRNIQYNHLALVNRGRAGDDAVLRMDGVDGFCDNVPEETKQEVSRCVAEFGSVPEFHTCTK